MKPSIKLRTALAACLLFLIAGATQAQLLDDNGIETIKLKDGTTVTLYRALPNELTSPDVSGKAKSAPPSNDYYYLPANLQLSTRPDGVPEFLFTKFTTESKAGVSGAIMHFLMQWGLSPAQQQELEQAIREKSKNPKAVVKGQIQLKPDEQGGSFNIISATLSDKAFATSIMNGRAPLLDGGKVAVATRLTADGAQLLESTFEKSKSISDLSISLNYQYTTILPAFKARMVYDWSRIRSYVDSMSYGKNATRTSGGVGMGFHIDNKTTTEETFRQLTDSLIEKKYAYIDIRESGITDERLTSIRQAFLDIFVKQFTVASETPAVTEIEEHPIGSENRSKFQDGLEDFSHAMAAFKRSKRKVEVKNTFKQKIMQGKREEIEINYSLPIQRNISIVGNLAAWYNHVRTNPNCVNTVNLNDPFFQHRDIRFILDLEAKEMFEQEINYVTVNARKTRSAGNPFSDRVTMDKKYFNEKGIQASMSYARGEDKDPDVYEYQAQWSLRGGNVWPKDPQWTKGSWEGVTLVPPLAPKIVEFEADMEELKAANFARVTLQIRYSKFGQEVEENISVSPAKNEAIVSKQIFMDRNTKGYAYRFIFNHKEAGKVATEFSSKINDYYAFANIPEEFKDKNSEGFKKGAEAAKVAAPPAADGKVTSGHILDKFKEIFGTVMNK